MLKSEASFGVWVEIIKKNIGGYYPYFPDKVYKIQKVIYEKGCTIVYIDDCMFLLTDLRLAANQGSS